MGNCFQCGMRTKDEWIICAYCGFKLEPNVEDNNSNNILPPQIAKVEKIEDSKDILNDILTKKIYQIIKDNPIEIFTSSELERNIGKVGDIKTSPIRMIKALNKLYASKLINKYSLKENYQYGYLDPNIPAKIQKKLELEKKRRRQIKLKSQSYKITQKLESEHVPVGSHVKLIGDTEPKNENLERPTAHLDVMEIPSPVKETELPKIEIIEKIERSEQHQIDLTKFIFDIFTHNPKKGFTHKAIINKLYREKNIEIKTPIISPILDRLLDSGLIKQELYEEESYYSFKTSDQTNTQLKLKLAIFNVLKSNFMRKFTHKEILKYLNREKHTIIYSRNINITGYHLQDMYRSGIINRQLFNNKVYFQFIKDPSNEFVMREGLEEIVNLIYKTQDINNQDNSIQDTVIQPEYQSTGTVCGIILCFFIPFAGSFLAFLFTLWMIKKYPGVNKYFCTLIISIILMISNSFGIYMILLSN